MRFLPWMLSLTMVAFFSTAGSAGHFDDVEDAADDYHKAVRKVHKELKKEKYAPPYVVQLTHRLEQAADRLEELADDERDVYTVRGAFAEIAALHTHFIELTHDPLAFGGRHAARRLDDIHRRFAELSAAVDRLSYPHPGTFGRRGGLHPSDHFGHPPQLVAPPHPQRHELQRHELQRHAPRRFELRIEVAPPAPGDRHHFDHHGRKLEKDLRKGGREVR